jgi:hypothetical protein
MLAHNAMLSRSIVDKLTSLLHKGSEEVAMQVRQLHAMLEATMMTNPALNQGARRRGQDPNHHRHPRSHSPLGDFASSSSPSRLGHGGSQDEGELWDVL